MKRFILAALLIAFAVFVPITSAKANCTVPCTKAQITTDITVNWPDNTIGSITPALLRSTVLDLVNSYYDLNGTTSLTCAASQWITALPTLSSITCAQPQASQVVSTQTGTGAVARTVQAKLGEVISVTDFGALCDGL